MWRALFFAIGTMLIILGLECLVTESFVVQGARIPGFVAKILDGTSKNPSGGPYGLNPGLAQNGTGNGASSFGSSRFNDNYSGQNQPGGSYYGGGPGSNANSQFSLAGYGSEQSGIAPTSQPWAGGGRQSNAGSPLLQRRIIQPKDWMPWSLLAAGSLVVLYTKSTVGLGGSNE